MLTVWRSPSEEFERRNIGTLPTPNFHDGNLRQTCLSDAVTVRAKLPVANVRNRDGYQWQRIPTQR